MGKMNNKIGKMLSRESMPSVDERGMGSGLRSILSKQAGTSMFKKYSQPQMINQADAGEAFKAAVDDAWKKKKKESKDEPEKEDPPKNEDKKEEKDKETVNALVINVDKDGNEEEQDQTGLDVAKMGDIYEPNMQDDVNISSSSLVQGQDGNPGDVTVEDNTLMKIGDKIKAWNEKRKKKKDSRTLKAKF